METLNPWFHVVGGKEACRTRLGAMVRAELQQDESADLGGIETCWGLPSGILQSIVDGDDTAITGEGVVQNLCQAFGISGSAIILLPESLPPEVIDAWRRSLRERQIALLDASHQAQVKIAMIIAGAEQL